MDEKTMAYPAECRIWGHGNIAQDKEMLKINMSGETLSISGDTSTPDGRESQFHHHVQFTASGKSFAYEYRRICA
jgi:hypothetical protein